VRRGLVTFLLAAPLAILMVLAAAGQATLAAGPAHDAHEVAVSHAGHGHPGHGDAHAGCTCDDLATVLCCGADCADTCAPDCTAGGGSGAVLTDAGTPLPASGSAGLRPLDQPAPRQPGLAPEGPPPQHA
jgi:hypothetical protein